MLKPKRKQFKLRRKGPLDKAEALNPKPLNHLKALKTEALKGKLKFKSVFCCLRRLFRTTRYQTLNHKPYKTNKTDTLVQEPAEKPQADGTEAGKGKWQMGSRSFRGSGLTDFKV